MVAGRAIESVTSFVASILRVPMGFAWPHRALTIEPSGSSREVKNDGVKQIEYSDTARDDERQNQIDLFLDVIQRSSSTGNAGDGMIFVSEIVDAIRIRDGARGEGALRAAPASPGVRQAS